MYVPCPSQLFNFVAAWGMMFWPLMQSDAQSRKVDNKLAWWLGIMFLTNVFFVPFLALRAAPEPPAGSATSGSAASSAAAGAVAGSSGAGGSVAPALLPSWSGAIGAAGAAVGLFSIAWAFVGRPELGGDLADRIAYAQHEFASNRVFYAFVIDSALYSVWQASFLADAPARFRYVPFFGMAAYLLMQPTAAAAPASEESSA